MRSMLAAALVAVAVAVPLGARAQEVSVGQLRDEVVELRGLSAAPNAGTVLGSLYLRGASIEPDAVAAAGWFRAGAAAGDPVALIMLSKMNLAGIGGPRDPAAAIGLLDRIPSGLSEDLARQVALARTRAETAAKASGALPGREAAARAAARALGLDGPAALPAPEPRPGVTDAPPGMAAIQPPAPEPPPQQAQGAAGPEQPAEITAADTGLRQIEMKLPPSLSQGAQQGPFGQPQQAPMQGAFGGSQGGAQFGPGGQTLFGQGRSGQAFQPQQLPIQPGGQMQPQGIPNQPYPAPQVFSQPGFPPGAGSLPGQAPQGMPPTMQSQALPSPVNPATGGGVRVRLARGDGPFELRDIYETAANNHPQLMGGAGPDIRPSGQGGFELTVFPVRDAAAGKQLCAALKRRDCAVLGAEAAQAPGPQAQDPGGSGNAARRPAEVARGALPGVQTTPGAAADGLLRTPSNEVLFAQIASVPTEEDAWLELNRLRMTLPRRITEGVRLYAEPAAIGGEQGWRIAAAGFSREDAARFCIQLAEVGEQCVVRERRK